MKHNRSDNQDRLAAFIRDGLPEAPRPSFTDNTMEKIRREALASSPGRSPVNGWKGLAVPGLVLLWIGAVLIMAPYGGEGHSRDGLWPVGFWLGKAIVSLKGLGGARFAGILLPVLVTSAVLFIAEQLVAGRNRRSENTPGF